MDSSPRDCTVKMESTTDDRRSRIGTTKATKLHEKIKTLDISPDSSLECWDRLLELLILVPFVSFVVTTLDQPNRGSARPLAR